MQIVYRAADLNDAHIVAGLLQSHGIEAYVGGHYLQGGVGDLAPVDLAKVYVEEEDADAAKEHVEAYQSQPNTLEVPSVAKHSSKTLVFALGFGAITLLVYLVAWT